MLPKKGFLEFSNWVEARTGIFLSEEKIGLVEARIRNRMDVLHSPNLADYLRIVESDPNEAKICIEALTTHKTEWFREVVHFKWLQGELLEKLRLGEPIHLWSAACSTGPEAYSLLFLCLKVGLKPDFIRLLATDLSSRVLQEAKRLPEESDFAHQVKFLQKHLPPGVNADSLVSKAVKESIKFRPFNLISDYLPANLLFDVIFVRNVLIYFDAAKRVEVCRRLMAQLKPGGHLVLGLSETIHQFIPQLVPLGNTIYRYEGEGEKPKVKIKHKEDIRVLIVEDSKAIVKLLHDIFQTMPRVKVVGAVSTVSEAKVAISTLKPDFVSLDLNLADGSGVDLLHSNAKLGATRYAVVSDCTPSEGNLVLDALASGAEAYLQKPDLKGMADFARALRELVDGFFPSTPALINSYAKRKIKVVRLEDYDLLAIGSSTGGTEVVADLLAQLPKDCPPIVVVQHMPAEFTALYASRLQSQTRRPTMEVHEAVEVERGCAYIAAGGRHLKIEKRGLRYFAIPDDGPAVNRFRPSVSRLFASLAEAMTAPRVIAIMLTGMGSDGAQEMLRLKELGALTLGQSEASSAVYGMPRAAAELGALCAQMSPEEMVDALANGRVRKPA